MKENAPLTVVVGKLASPEAIKTENGELIPVEDWQGRAAWSYLRLVYGRSVDDQIKAVNPKDRPNYIKALMFKAAQERPLQFIMSSGQVIGVATTKHLLIPPEQVYDAARQILGQPFEVQEGLHGQIYYLDGFAGIKTGVQIDGGDLTTRFAIRVGVFARVELCFNPLSWLGVSGLGRFAIPSDYERVLRIQKLNELFPRLKAAIVNAKGKLADLEKRVEHTKRVSLSPTTANILNGAMCMAYGLGEKTIRQVMERYNQAEDKTQYGLAMAQSWTAQHGEHRKTPEGQTCRVPQSLSTISGATLLIDDIKTAEAKAKKWLQDQRSREAARKLAEAILKGEYA
jgi:hypothetical protein